MPILQFFRQNSAWLGAGVLLAFMSSFGQTFFISIFSGHIRAEFGLSHAAWGGFLLLGHHGVGDCDGLAGHFKRCPADPVFGAFRFIWFDGGNACDGQSVACVLPAFCNFRIAFIGAGHVLASGRGGYVALVCGQSGARAVDRGTGIFVRRSFSARIVRVFNGLCVVALFMVRCCRDAFIVFTSFISIAASRANPAIYGGR